MKNRSSLLSFVLLLSIGLLFGNCSGGDDEKSEEEVQLDKLKGTWTLTSVNNDGDDRTAEYPGMTVVVTGTFATAGVYNYTSTATDWPSVSPWKAIDTWKFKTGAISSVIVRQTDLLDMNYALSNGDNTVVFTFDYTGVGYNNGRTEKVEGAWSFTFTK